MLFELRLLRELRLLCELLLDAERCEELLDLAALGVFVDAPVPLVPEALADRVEREAKYEPALAAASAGRVVAVLNSRPYEVSTKGGTVKCRSHEPGPIQLGSSLEGWVVATGFTAAGLVVVDRGSAAGWSELAADRLHTVPNKAVNAAITRILVH